MLNHTRWAIGVLTLSLTVTASSQTDLEVSWGSSILEQKMILNDGSPLDSGPITVEVGSFGSFTPTADNLDQWLANWKVFDAITDPDTDPNGSDFLSFNAGDHTLAKYAGSANLEDTTQTSDSEDAAIQNPAATFGPSEQGYVFFRTGDAVIADNQWLLFTSAVDADGAGLGDSVWEFPTVSGLPQPPLAWWLDQADTAIVGAINGGDTKGGSSGAGCFTDTSTDFAIRLHCVPEPVTGLLVLISSVPLLCRRKRT